MFDVTGQDIAALSDEDLRTLVGRLCEAELRRLELSPLLVTWGGHQNATDGGVDVRVTLSGDAPLSTAFARKNIVYQVKAEDMPRGKILAEMILEGIVDPRSKSSRPSVAVTLSSVPRARFPTPLLMTAKMPCMML